MNEDDLGRRDVASRRAKQGFALFAIVAGFFLVLEHRAHVLPYLPWLLLAACPLMHLFMHHGHGGHHHRQDAGRARARRPDETSDDGDASAGTPRSPPGEHS